jgi:hypothetical protein
MPAATTLGAIRAALFDANATPRRPLATERSGDHAERTSRSTSKTAFVANAGSGSV